MSRRIGAYVLFDQQSFTPEVSAMIDRSTDLTPVMVEIAGLALQEGKERLAAGGENWPPNSPETLKRERRRGGSEQIGISQHGGFAPFMFAFWSARNAGWKTRAPHAHLFQDGTQQYTNDSGGRTFRWGSKSGGRVSRKRAAGLAGTTWNGRMRQPARYFAYISDGLHERANDRIAAFILQGQETPS